MSLNKKSAVKASSSSVSNSFSALADAAEDADHAEVTSSSRPASGAKDGKASQKLRDPLVWIDLEMTGGATCLGSMRHNVTCMLTL